MNDIKPGPIGGLTTAISMTATAALCMILVSSHLLGALYAFYATMRKSGGLELSVADNKCLIECESDR